MIESFETRGVWFLPGAEAGPIAGTLSFSPQHGLTLTLIGSLSEAFTDLRSNEYPVIHGVITDSPYGRLVTLVDSFTRSSTLSIPGFASEEIKAHRAYIGAHLSSEGGTYVRSFRARYSHLDNWSEATGFDRSLVERRETGTLSVEYRQPPKQTLRIGEAEMNVEAAASARQGGRRVEIREEVHAAAEHLRGTTVPQVLDEYVFPFQDFLSFAVDTPCALEELALRLDIGTATEATRQGPVYVLYEPVFWPSAGERPVSSAEMLFTSSETVSVQPNLFERWLEFRRRFGSVYKTFHASRYAPPRYLETQFLMTLATLVLFFEGPGRLSDVARGHFDFGEMAPPGIREAERDRRWFKDIVPTNAELALPWELFALARDYADLFSSAVRGGAEEFVSGVLALRRQLTTGTGDQPPADPLVLLRNVTALSLLLNVCVLEYLGFSPNDIQQRLSRTRRYLTLLALHKNGAVDSRNGGSSQQ